METVDKGIKVFSPTELEPPNTPPVYRGKPLSLEDMERAVLAEAGKLERGRLVYTLK